MPIERERIAIPLAQGVDRGTEPQIATGNLTTRNAVIDRAGAISKRHGWAAKSIVGATFDSYPILGALKEVPVLIGDDVRVGLNTTAATALSTDFLLPSEAAKNHGGLADVGPLHFVSGNGDKPDLVDIGGSAASGFFVVAMSYVGSSHVYVIDASTGALVDNRQVWSGAGTAFVRVLTTDSYIWYVYIEPASGDIEGAEVDPTAGAAAVPAPGTIYNTTAADTTYLALDVCHIDTDTAAIVFVESTVAGVQSLVFNAANGTVSANAHWANAVTSPKVAAVKYSSTTFAVALLDRTHSATPTLVLEVRGLDTAAATQFTVTGIDTDATNSITYDITGIADSATSITFYYTVGRYLAAAGNEFDWQRRHIKKVVLTSGTPWTAGSPSVQLYNCALASKPFLDPYDAGTTHAFMARYQAACGADPTGSPAYTGVPVRSQVGSTFVVRLAAGLNKVIGKVAINATYVPVEERGSSNYSWDQWALGLGAGDYTGRLPHVLTAGTLRTFPVAVLGAYDVYHTESRRWAGGGAVYKKVWFDYIAAARGSGAYIAQVDYDVTSVKTLEGRDWLAIPNGNPYEFDGQGIVEQGFHWYPEDVKVTDAHPGTGAITGVISFAVVAHWEDDAGNTHWSAPTITDSIEVTNALDFDIRIACLTLTRKPNVRFYVYRTKPAGSAYYLIGTVVNVPTSETVTLSAAAWSTDAWSNWPTAVAAELQGAGLYTDGNVLDDVQPPAYRVTALHQGRQFVVHREMEDSLILYSKEGREKVAGGFNELLQLWVNPEGGRIMALASMGDRLCIFKQRSIYVVDGVGLNELGQGAGYSEPQLVGPHVGCIEQKSIARVPNGLMFNSDSGIQILDRSLRVLPIGERVKSYTDAADVAAAVALPGSDSALFVFSTAGTEALLYNWEFDQWTTWTNSAARDAILIDGQPWLLSTDFDPVGADTNSVVALSTTSYVDVDAGISHVPLTIETAWYSFNDLAGRKRVHRMLLMGYIHSAQTLITIKVAYDFDPVWVDTLTLSTMPLPFDHDDHYGAGLATTYVDAAALVRFIGSRKKFTSVRFSITEAP